MGDDRRDQDLEGQADPNEAVETRLYKGKYYSIKILIIQGQTLKHSCFHSLFARFFILTLKHLHNVYEVFTIPTKSVLFVIINL